jgi:hypothetical protein
MVDACGGGGDREAFERAMSTGEYRMRVGEGAISRRMRQSSAEYGSYSLLKLPPASFARGANGSGDDDGELDMAADDAQSSEPDNGSCSGGASAE